jgi:hypothetical protein
MVEPGLADRRKFAAEPAGHDVDIDAAVGEMADRRDLLGEQRRVPRARQHGGDDAQPLGCGPQRMADGHRFMLVVGAVAGGEADLAERVFEAVLLRDLGEPAVIVDPLMGALFDQADH